MLDSKAIRAEMARLLRQPTSQLENTTILTGLVTDSFELVEMVIELQERFMVRLTQEDLRDVKTVGDLERVLVSKTR
jgi:acyl carrier protein